MSLERFAGGRLVILDPGARALMAARAMADNGIGAVLVANAWGLVGILTDRDVTTRVAAMNDDLREITVGDIMTRDVHSLHVDASIVDVARIMRLAAVRRVPLLNDDNRPIGIVTLDDLLVDELLPSYVVSDILQAQLTAPARNKRGGDMRPGPVYGRRPDGAARSRARAESTYGHFLHEVGREARLDREGDGDLALVIVLGGLCRRITPDLARHFLAQLPSLLIDRLSASLDGPDRSITRERLEWDVQSAFDVSPGRAREIIRAVIRVIERNVSEGQIATIRGQLPDDLRALFLDRGQGFFDRSGSLERRHDIDELDTGDQDRSPEEGGGPLRSIGQGVKRAAQSFVRRTL